MGKLKLFLLISGVCVVLFAFQNCGEISLNATQNSSTETATGEKGVSGNVCAPGTSPFLLDRFMVLNVTSIAQGAALASDSNVNGLPDSSDPDPSSRATVRLSGADTDGDGVPDFIETLRGLNPNTNDAFDDSKDQDGSSNVDEVMLGTDPASSQNPQTLNLYSINETGPDTECAPSQTVYKFEIRDFQKVYNRALTDQVNSGKASLSHDADENIILVYAAFRDDVGSLPDKKLFKLFKVKKSNDSFGLTIKPSDFSELP